MIWDQQTVYARIGLEDPVEWAYGQQRINLARRDLRPEAVLRLQNRQTGRSTVIRARAVAAALNGKTVYIAASTGKMEEVQVELAQEMYDKVARLEGLPIPRTGRHPIRSVRKHKNEPAFRAGAPVFHDHPLE